MIICGECGCECSFCDCLGYNGCAACGCEDERDELE